MLEGGRYLKERIDEISKGTRLAFIGILMLLIVALPVYNLSAIVGSPSNAILPGWIRFQYLEGWPAGTGMKEVIDYLKRGISKGEITVGSKLAGDWASNRRFTYILPK